MPPPTKASTDPNCIFCKIAAGQIPCFKVYEDDLLLGFLDIGPLVTGHTLIIPKSHHVTIMETPPEVLAAIGRVLPKVSQAVLGAVGSRACHILVNNGSEAMQSVHHLHYHILPRKAGDTFRIPWNAGSLDKAQGAVMAEVIRRNVL